TPQHFRDLVRYVMANPFLTDVALAGPFSSAEKSILDVNDPLHSKGAKWTSPVVGPPGKIVLPTTGYKQECFAYVAAELAAPAALRTRLLLGCPAAVRVWLNGKAIYHGTPAKGQTGPDQAGVDVDLRPGS